jgi:hypothetical protein
MAEYILVTVLLYSSWICYGEFTPLSFVYINAKKRVQLSTCIDCISFVFTRRKWASIEHKQIKVYRMQFSFVFMQLIQVRIRNEYPVLRELAGFGICSIYLIDYTLSKLPDRVQLVWTLPK